MAARSRADLTRAIAAGIDLSVDDRALGHDEAGRTDIAFDRTRRLQIEPVRGRDVPITAPLIVSALSSRRPTRLMSTLSRPEALCGCGLSLVGVNPWRHDLEREMLDLVRGVDVFLNPMTTRLFWSIEERFPVGWSGDVAANINNSWGIVAEIGGVYRSDTDLDVDLDLYTFGGGARGRPENVARRSIRPTGSWMGGSVGLIWWSS